MTLLPTHVFPRQSFQEWSKTSNSIHADMKNALETHVTDDLLSDRESDVLFATLSGSIGTGHWTAGEVTILSLP
jgi:hypothetical protein